MAVDSYIPNPSLGENTRIAIGEIMLQFSKGNVDSTPEEKDTGSNLAGGYTTQVRGRRKLTFDLEAVFDPEAPQPFTSEGGAEAPVLFEGENTSEPVTIYPDFVNLPGVFYYLPIAWISSLKMTLDGTGTVTYQMAGKNQGIFGTPNDPIE